MPLNSSLIRGRKFVWGKTQLQFGKTTVYRFFSKITDKSVVSGGGGTIQDFDMFALDYDAIGTFLSQYFRNKYDSSLKTIHLLTVGFKYQG
jgi:cell surface protein SprA